MDKDNSLYSSSDQNTSISKQSHRQQLATLDKSTPLSFALRINGEYYISYKQSQLWMNIIRSSLWILINTFIIYVINGLENLGDTLKSLFSYGLIAQNILYILLCFLDAGTLFEDQEDSYNQQRSLCMTCSIYKLRNSRHCIWCNKCVKKYDHHCSVFGKCIGKRNIVIFYLFIIVCGLETPSLIIAFVTHVLGSQAS